MDRRLIEAAKKGDVDKLHNLIKDVPFLLRAVALAIGETPLHIACIGGHVDFVKEVLNLRPELAKELNQDGFSPLHIASASGDVEIVKELLKVGFYLCLVKGKEKRIPLHYAVAKGRIQVIRELLSACLDSITEVTARGENCFHLAVKNNQFEAFKVLSEHVVAFNKEDILNKKDEQGNTILHLAASRKQYECLNLLLDENCFIRGTVKLKVPNAKGLTALDISDMVIQDSYDANVRETNWFEHFKFQMQRDSPSDTRNALLVVAALIATVSFQAGDDPPSGIFDQPHQSNSTNQNSHKHPGGASSIAGAAAIFGSHGTALLFLFANSLGLTASICIIIYLTGGFPFQGKLHISLYSMMFTYGFATKIVIRGTEAQNKVMAYVLVTVAYFLPFALRWLPMCGKRAWNYWRERAVRNARLPIGS
ncbi:hypothetical protein Pfo_005707 [Paulownia fortunei]|nr:hypothetical protein Pfo_005707 [Paulownia fortunei]